MKQMFSGPGPGVIWGAGVGMIFGAVFGNPGAGMILGAACGLVLGRAAADRNNDRSDDQ